MFSERQNGQCSTDNVIIVPHVKISQNESYLFNRAIRYEFSEIFTQ